MYKTSFLLEICAKLCFSLEMM